MNSEVKTVNILSTIKPKSVAFLNASRHNRIASGDNRIASGNNRIASGNNRIVSGNNRIVLLLQNLIRARIHEVLYKETEKDLIANSVT
ncbi:MAG: hypothetical protein KME38_18095 [Spirirestis rafaelensis WJT71-NPBG6]|jgi:hypothetical protein|nr:hypothetical protein [Spirirestis rafaelensis WJT71-NPBG6]